MCMCVGGFCGGGARVRVAGRGGLPHCRGPCAVRRERTEPLSLGGGAAVVMPASNFVAASAPGCHVAANDVSFVLGTERVAKLRRRLGHKGRLPELSLDPKSKVLSLINSSNDSHVYFVSICHPCEGRDGTLEMGSSRDANGVASKCVTLVVQVPPQVVVDACTIQVARARDVDIDSDIVTLPAERAAPSSSTESGSEPVVIGFPLPLGEGYLCSQSAGGALTHRWHASTHHAVDLQAPHGTPVLAVLNGRVLDIKDGAVGGGCHVRGLFAYNALTIEHVADRDGLPLYVEYVHVRAGSLRVAVGDEVRQGDVVAEVGDAGFCPVAHLHIEAHRMRSASAPSVPIAFATLGAPECTFVAVAGRWYDARKGDVSEREDKAGMVSIRVSENARMVEAVYLY